MDTLRDTAPQTRADAALQLAAEVFEHSGESIFVTDVNGIILAANRAFTEITGYPQEEAIGQSAGMLSSGSQAAEFFDGIRHSLDLTGSWRGEVINRRKSGEVYVGWMTIAAVRDATGAIGRFVSILSDVTAFKAVDERTRYLAQHDFLTGLANRGLFEDRFDSALLRAKRFNHALALLLVDLDRFKQVNDTFGHATGDDLLKQVAARLQASVRQTDTVARLGGDEFVVVLPDLQAVLEAERVARKIVAELSRGFVADGHPVTISASIGISGFPVHGDERKSLMRVADAAMYRVKQSSGGGYRFGRPQATLPAGADHGQPRLRP